MGRILTFLLAWSAGGLSLWAGVFKVEPFRIEFAASRPRASVAVTNLGDGVATIQVQVLRWTAKGAGEDYAETDDILINPPIFTLAAGQTQYLRLGLREPRAGLAEISYRLILEELPPPRKPNSNEITTLLRISVPIFVKPAAKTVPELAWRLVPDGAGAVKLSVENRGKVHVQFKRMGLTTETQPQPDRFETVGIYLLPGGRQEWAIRDERLVRSSHILVKAQTDRGELGVTVFKGELQ
jgi:fimbrial chaperone protein